MDRIHLSDKILSVVDPQVVAIPIQECGETMINLRDQDVLAFGESPEIPDNPFYTKLRKTVYRKLVAAQRLLPNHLRLCLYEGYRSLELQNLLFCKRYQSLNRLHPEWDKIRLFHETTKLVCPLINPDGTLNTPPHSTGGAIDVYLIDRRGNLVDMGIPAADWMTDLDGSLSRTDSSTISGIAQMHRSMMSRALEKVGFVNYPAEYWHWSYGDRYWAYLNKKPFALYGPVRIEQG
ncbi:D-alanyl-D-alanine dipeptidase [Oxalobacteraceae bacterium GrIS 2.11]